MAIKDYKNNISNFKKTMDKSFTKKGRKMTMGVEVEMYLLYHGKPSCRDLMKDSLTMNNILFNLPQEITRDYYPYQIEIRTNPHDNPEAIIKEFDKFLRESIKVCAEFGCSIVPLSWMGGSEIFNKTDDSNIDLKEQARRMLEDVKKNEKYENKIINIHPALLPDYGGKGMYGKHVHDAVIAAGESKSGITIHLVNKIYDDGQIIFQTDIKIAKNETPDSLAGKIHLLEYEHFPEVIKSLLI